MADERFRIIFEGQGDLDPVLQKLERAFDRLASSDPFAKITETAQSAMKALDDLASRVSEGFTGVTRAIDALQQTLQQIPVDKADQLDRAMDRVEKTTKRTIVGFGHLQAALGAVAHSASRGFDAVGTQIRSLEEGLGQSIGGALSGIGTSLGKFASGGLSGNLFSGLIEGARNALTTIAGVSNSAVQGVISAAQSIVGSVGNLFGELQKAGSSAVGGILGALTGVVTGLGPAVAVVGTMIGNAVGSASKAVIDMQVGLVNAGLSVASGVADLATGFAQAAVNTAAAVLNGLVTVAQNVVEKVAQAFAGLVEKVTGFVGDLVGKVTLGLTGISSVAATQSIRFRDEMAVTFGLVAEEGPEAFRSMVAQVRDVMAETPFLSWTEGARGLFQAISFGIRDPIQRIEALQAATDLAVGGGMKDLGTSMQAIARLMDQFGISAREAADRIFTMQNQASLAVSDIAQGIGQVVGTARLAGQSLDEIGTAITFISRVLPPEETFVSLNRLLLGLVQPPPATAKSGYANLFEEMGVQLRDAENHLLPLSRIMDQLRSKNLNDQQLTDLFPNIRSLRGAIPLLMNSAEQTEAMTAAMKQFEGSAQRASEVVESQLGARLSKTWSQFTGLIDQVVERIEGPLGDALTGLTDYLREIRQSPGFDSFADSVGRALSSVVSFVENGLRYVIENWGQIEAGARQAWGTVAEVANTAYGVLKTTWDLLQGWVSGGPESGIASAWDAVKAASTEALAVLRAYASGDVEPLRLAFERLWTWVEGRATVAWDKIKATALSSVAGLVDTLAGFLAGKMQAALSDSPFLAFFAELSGVKIPEVPEGMKDLLLAQRDVGRIQEKLPGLEPGENANALLRSLFGVSPAIPRLNEVAGQSIQGKSREELGALLETLSEQIAADLREMNPVRPFTQELERMAEEAGQAASEHAKITAEKNDELREAYEDAVRAWRKAAGPTGPLGEVGLAGVEGVLGPPMPSFGGSTSSAAGPLASPFYFMGGSVPSVAETTGTSAIADLLRQSLVMEQPTTAKPAPEEWKPKEFFPGMRNPRSPLETIPIGTFTSPGPKRAVGESSTFGMGFGSLGTRVDVIRQNEQRMQQMMKERTTILGGLDTDTRKRVVGRLSPRYSLNDLRTAAEEERTTGPRVEVYASQKKQRGASFYGDAEIPKADGGAVAGQLGAAAAAAEKAADATDTGVAEELAQGQQLVEQLEALAAATKERADAAGQADAEQKALFDEVLANVRDEIQKIKAEVEDLKRRREQAKRQFS